VEQKNPASEASRPRELTGWKEIADYLGVNLRTAQKWERLRGLPVRRRSGPRSRVSADAEAVNAWRKKLSVGTTHSNQSYRLPLGNEMTVEVRFLGDDPEAPHVDLLREYLELFKKSLK
jgi:hypothetical protein